MLAIVMSGAVKGETLGSASEIRYLAQGHVNNAGVQILGLEGLSSIITTLSWFNILHLLKIWSPAHSELQFVF